MSLASFKLLVLLSIAANLFGMTRGLARSADTARDEQDGPRRRRELTRPADDFEVTTPSLDTMGTTMETDVKQKRRLHPSGLHYVCASLPWRILPRKCLAGRASRRPGRGRWSKIRNRALSGDARSSRLRRIAILNWWRQVKLGGKPSPPIPGGPNWVPDTRFGRASQ
ncbi:Hypp1502 [Branchiostoma lanceolatum]|uniref:Hypp1502 protein n=1 Tax=Branchiostoma lanceolatum TaxID=7740 RepID=A0A8J9ZJU1_BRALA|nr:Hypp1502 [Branchiostoma lanceolatum]